MQSLEDIWKIVLDLMKQEFSSTSLNLWFSDLELISLTDSTAVLLCPSEFKKGHISRHYIPTIAKYLKEVLNFEVNVELKLKTDPEKKNGFFSEMNLPEKSGDGDEPSFYESKKKKKNPFNSSYTFENFIVGNSNKFAHAMCIAVANNPGTEYNPLFIYGPSGLGKTHLLYAITNHISQNNPELDIVYVKGEEFTNQLIENIKYKSTESFRERYRKADVLLIDDIQFIAGRVSTQEEFFHTFNALYEDNRQIILTSDRPPKDIEHLEERLRTRFESSLPADIQPPDYELRLAILKSKAELMGLNMPHEVMEYIAKNLKNNVRQLEGAIKKVSAQSFLSGDPITIDLTISCIADMMTGSEPMSVTAEKILDKVSKRYGISSEDIKGKKQTRDIANARHIFIYITKKLTDMSYPAIGKILNRNYSSMISSYKLIEGKMSENTLFEIEIDQLVAEVKDQ
ncbi:MAG: chromosomal replication initiator protein DnaA [Ruminococcaceae bacterium]|nr:chromosomal replication initiator protein DnaA [Oscillospiraceae bacterium]